MDIDFGFLLGAGTSQAFGLPSTNEITHTILGSRLTYRDTISRYRLADKLFETYENGYPLWLYQRKPAQQVQEFLNTLHQFICRYNDRFPGLRTDPNFENIYYLASLVRDGLRGAYPDPAIGPLLELLQTQDEPFSNFRTDLLEIAGKSMDYIIDIVAEMLKPKTDKFKSHDLLSGAFKSRSKRPLDIFSLNFDLQIESYFAGRRISVIDGFGEVLCVNGVRYWDPARFHTDNPCIRLFKLHGSLNWRYWAPMDNPREKKLGISTARSWQETVFPGGETAYPPDKCVILVGMQNKVHLYSSGQPLEMLCAAKRAWDELDVIVVIGYSFRDQGINRLLYQWVSGKRRRKLLVVPRKRDSLLEKAAPVFAQHWAQEWECQRKLFFHEKDFKVLQWSELQDVLKEHT